MPAVRATIRLRTVDDYIRRVHGRNRSLNRTESAIIDQYADRIIRRIRAQWPIDTGTSWGKWQYKQIPWPGEIALVIENPMNYTTFVHPAGTAPNPSKSGSIASSYAGRLISQQVQSVKAGLVAALRRAIDATEAQTAAPEEFREIRTIQDRIRLLQKARADREALLSGSNV